MDAMKIAWQFIAVQKKYKIKMMDAHKELNTQSETMMKFTKELTILAAGDGEINTE